MCKTRASVLKLNNLVLQSLVDHNVTASTVSIFPDTITNMRVLERDGPLHVCNTLIPLGIFPVFHGDAVFDSAHRCTIFSGDKIMIWLAENLENRPKLAVFLTDVRGVLDRPPTVDDAELVEEIVVKSDGSIRFPETTTASHDVTGGIRGKIECAVEIAKLGVPVVIVQIGTDHALKALSGEIPFGNCTLIRLEEEKRNVITD